MIVPGKGTVTSVKTPSVKTKLRACSSPFRHKQANNLAFVVNIYGDRYRGPRHLQRLRHAKVRHESMPHAVCILKEPNELLPLIDAHKECLLCARDIKRDHSGVVKDKAVNRACQVAVAPHNDPTPIDAFGLGEEHPGHIDQPYLPRGEADKGALPASRGTKANTDPTTVNGLWLSTEVTRAIPRTDNIVYLKRPAQDVAWPATIGKSADEDSGVADISQRGKAESPVVFGRSSERKR